MHKNILVKAIFKRWDNATAAIVRCGFIVFGKCCAQKTKMKEKKNCNVA